MNTSAATVLVLILATVSMAPAHAASAACTAVENRQFDFWVGHWNVFTPDGKPAGTSHIELIAGRCALLENWNGRGGVIGKSLNTYDTSDGHWHQFWVDSTGSTLALTGDFRDGKMILEGVSRESGSPIAQRITWSRNADASIRQLWESSSDRKQWKVEFDGKYVAAK